MTCSFYYLTFQILYINVIAVLLVDSQDDFTVVTRGQKKKNERRKKAVVASDTETIQSQVVVANTPGSVPPGSAHKDLAESLTISVI